MYLIHIKLFAGSHHKVQYLYPSVKFVLRTTEIAYERQILCHIK